MPGMRPSSDRPVNDPLSRTGHVQKPSIDGDPRRIIIGYPGYGKQPADNRYETRRQGERVPTLWHQEVGQWRPQAPPEFVGSNITLLKVWQLNANTDDHNHIAIHPTQPWMATVRNGNTLEVYNWETEALLDDIATTGNVNDVKWSPFGDYIALAVSASPYIVVHPVNTTTGVISAAVSNPASLAPGQGDTVVWHPRQAAIYLNYEGGGANYVSGWPFTTVFGTRFTAPADVEGWGYGDPGAQVWVDIAAYTREAAITNIWGLAIAPDGSALVMRAGDGAWSWLLQLNLNHTGSFGNRYDTMYKLVSAEEANGPSPSWPQFDEHGSVIVWGNINGVGASVASRGTLAYACEFSHFGFGHLNGSPFPDDILLNGGVVIVDRYKGPKWRPGGSHPPQVMLVLDQQNADTETRLALYTMGGARFLDHVEWITDEGFSWDFLNAGTGFDDGFLQSAWSPDGAHFFVGLGGSTIGGLTDAIAVFRVT